MYSKGKKKGRTIKIIFIASEFEENLTHFRDILEFFSHRLWWARCSREKCEAGWGLSRGKI